MLISITEYSDYCYIANIYFSLIQIALKYQLNKITLHIVFKPDSGNSLFSALETYSWLPKIVRIYLEFEM